jgi:hypothetical protein
MLSTACLHFFKVPNWVLSSLLTHPYNLWQSNLTPRQQPILPKGELNYGWNLGEYFSSYDAIPNHGVATAISRKYKNTFL